MNPKDLIKAGKLSEAREQLIDEVKSSPADLGTRTLLFQVLVFSGEWDKAERHLDVIAAQDADREVGAQVYKNLIHAEKERMEVAKLSRRASFIPETPAYIELYYTAWEKLSQKEIEEAQALFDQVDAQRPTVSGTVNGKTFASFKDTDTFLSLFLEAMVYERYVWIPFESIRELSITPPSTLFDLLWTTARITTWEGLTTNCYLPVLYPDSFLHEDDRVKLGRMTDWAPLGGSFSKGMGQHVFETGDEEVAMLEIREALFTAPDVLETDKKSD